MYILLASKNYIPGSPCISLFPFSLLHCFSVYLLIYFSISQMTAKFYHAGYKKRFPKFSTRFFVFLSTQILLKSLLHILGQFSFPISGKNIKKRKFFDFFRRFAKVTLFCNGLVICHKWLINLCLFRSQYNDLQYFQRKKSIFLIN